VTMEWLATLTFWVDGVPVPKARARTVRVKGKPITFTPRRTARWEACVRLMALSACSAALWKPLAGRYEVDIEVHRKSRRGDADNFAKAICDAMNGVAYPDDRSVMRLGVSLVDGDGVGARVRVRRSKVLA